MPDLGEIAVSSGLPSRKLRYVLDQGLLPGGSCCSRGRGAARYFDPFEVFGLVVATLLLEAGLGRALVREVMAALVRSAGPEPSSIPLFRASLSGGPARLEIGDGSYVRMIGEVSLRSGGTSKDWLSLGDSPSPPATYEPLVTIVLDISQVRSKVSRPR